METVYEVELCRNEKGLYARIDRASEDHPRSAGMIFFPDRTWTDVCEGPAKVVITTERETYGFIKGAMENWEEQTPDMQPFLDWAWSNPDLPGSTLVGYVPHPIRGRYMVIMEPVEKKPARPGANQHAWKRVKRTRSGEISICFFNTVARNDIREYGVKPIKSLNELFARDAFGKTPEELDAMFERSEWLGPDAKSLGLPWIPDSRLVSSELDEAVRKGLLSQHTLPGHKDVILLSQDADPDEQDAFLSFTMDELEEIAMQANALNRKTDEIIRKKLKSGKLRLL